RIGDRNVLHLPGVHARHSNLGAIGQASEIDELCVEFTVVGEHLMPVADQKHSGAEQHQAAHDQHADVLWLHLDVSYSDNRWRTTSSALRSTSRIGPSAISRP